MINRHHATYFLRFTETIHTPAVCFAVLGEAHSRLSYYSAGMREQMHLYDLNPELDPEYALLVERMARDPSIRNLLSGEQVTDNRKHAAELGRAILAESRDWVSRRAMGYLSSGN